MTSIALDNVLRLSAIVNVKEPRFGATGDGVTDDAPAIQDALDYVASSGRRGIVYIPSGTYILGSTLSLGIDTILMGEGPGLASKLQASHSAGAVIRVQGERSGVCRLNIGATSARTSGSASGNYGILHEPSDTSSAVARFGKYEDLVIEDQPSHGMVMVATINFSSLKRINIVNNLGHGLVFDNGTMTSRTNLAQPGLATVDEFAAYDNTGHGLVVGGEAENTNRGVRLTFNNMELARNAEAAGVRKSADQAWIFGDQIFIKASAFGGLNQAGDTIVTRGINAAGRSHFIHGNRFVEVTRAILVNNYSEFSTRGVDIKELHVTGTLQTSLDPVVDISADAQRVFVESGANTFTTSLVSVDRPELIKRTLVIYKVADETVNNSSALQNDDTLKYSLLAKERVGFRAFLCFTGDASADIKFAFTVPSGASIRWGTPSGTIVDASDAVVVQATVVGSGTAVTFGTAGAVRRHVELVGEIETTGTAGDLQLQWAQASPVVADTKLLDHSRLEIT